MFKLNPDHKIPMFQLLRNGERYGEIYRTSKAAHKARKSQATKDKVNRYGVMVVMVPQGN